MMRPRLRDRIQKEILEARTRFHVETILENGDIVGIRATIPFLGRTRMLFAPDHPFRPPRIVVNDRPFHDALGKMSRHQYQRYSEIFGGDCVCCDLSFQNKDWSPAITILFVLLRLQSMMHRRHRVLYEDVVEEILFRNHLPDHVPILEFI